MYNFNEMSEKEKKIYAQGIIIGYNTGYKAKMYEILSDDECLGKLSEQWYGEIENQIDIIKEYFHFAPSPEEVECKMHETVKEIINGGN